MQYITFHKKSSNVISYFLGVTQYSNAYIFKVTFPNTDYNYRYIHM